MKIKSFDKHIIDENLLKMNYLKKYKLFESQEVISGISDCFLSVSDMTYTKIRKTPLHNIEVSIGLNTVSKFDSGISKFGVKYKELINGVEISQEIANSISISMGMGFKVIRAEVTWVSAGEWTLANPDKQGIGPGELTKIFNQGGQFGPMDMIDRETSKARYSPEILPDFIEDKGTRLRYIRIIYHA